MQGGEHAQTVFFAFPPKSIEESARGGAGRPYTPHLTPSVPSTEDENRPQTKTPPSSLNDHDCAAHAPSSSFVHRLPPSTAHPPQRANHPQQAANHTAEEQQGYHSHIMASPSPSDPSGLLTSPPSTFVKITGTSRDDLNGKMCVALQYDTGRGRYMVQLLPGQQQGAGAVPTAGAPAAMSFKPDNLVRPSMMEKVGAQARLAKHEATRLISDPDSRERAKRAYTSANQRLPGPVKPEHAAIGLGVAWLLMARSFGVSKAVLATTLLLVTASTTLPDLIAGADASTVAKNFPKRLREQVAQSTGYSSVTERQALAGLGVLFLLSAKLLLTPAGAAAAAGTARPSVPSMPPSPIAGGAEELYRLGYDDAKAGRDFGTSLPEDPHPSRPAGADLNFPYQPDAPPPLPPSRKNKFGIGSVLAAFSVFRFAKELGVTPDGRFDPRLLVANVRVQKPWKLAIMGLSVYRLVSALI